MSLFAIPEEDVQSLFLFSQLSEEIKEGIYEILKKIKIGDHPKKIAKIISDDYDVDNEDTYSVIVFYFSLVKSIYQTETTDEEIIADIINSILEDVTFDFDPEDLKGIENTIKSFLALKSEIPVITSLAFDMTLGAGNLFLRSNIYEELRPVFFNEKIMGLSLFHTLKLHVRREDSSHTDLFLAIDSDDINDIIDQLTEAKNRAEQIKNEFGSLVIQL